jgi:hypothetical protein
VVHSSQRIGQRPKGVQACSDVLHCSVVKRKPVDDRKRGKL